MPRPTFAVSLALTGLLAACASSTRGVEREAVATATPEHAWLQQLVGEWRMVGEAVGTPGLPAARMESEERVRSIGGLWVQAESHALMNGEPFTSVMTVGYDLRAQRFVGSWIDSLQTHQWIYHGTLDAARRVLTLEAEGPAFGDATKNALYRDAIEIVDADHRVLRSSVRNADGTWTQFMTARYTRER